METKQVIVIRKDLNMRKGKMIAQGAHASMKVFFDRLKQYATYKDGRADYDMHVTEAMKEWIEDAFTKICVYVTSEQHLISIYQQAVDAGVPAALIRDAGRTEFGGIPTLTACAVGPDEVSKVDAITKLLPLL